MPPIVLTLVQAVLLLLLYLFVARAVRAVLRDVARAAPATAVPASHRPAPAPAPGRRKRSRAAPGELVVHTPEGRPRVVPLDASDITFGRADSSTVALNDEYVSDAHARVFRNGDGWVVSDLGSTNGTFLNQVRVTTPTPLAAGDQLGIGRTVVQVRR